MSDGSSIVSARSQRERAARLFSLHPPTPPLPLPFSPSRASPRFQNRGDYKMEVEDEDATTAKRAGSFSQSAPSEREPLAPIAGENDVEDDEEDDDEPIVIAPKVRKSIEALQFKGKEGSCRREGGHGWQ